MSARALVVFALATVAVLALAALQVVPGPVERPRSSFMTLDVQLDSGSSPLAAWQVEVAATSGEVRIVGIEGGEHEAFSSAPHYDERAMMQERVVIAAFSTLAAERLPSGETRVATIHVQVVGEEPAAFEAFVEAAATVGARKIDARVILVEGSGA